MAGCPTVIDLYSGVGGLSLSAARAGFALKAAVEIDPRAIEAHSRNFPKTKHFLADVASLTGKKLLEDCGLKIGELTGLIGGPPCQGFSLMGRKDDADPRNMLLGHFFRIVAEVRPHFFVGENVPGLLTDRSINTMKQALSLVPDTYTVLAPVVVKANEYGAPTTRTRILLVGFDSSKCDPIVPDSLLPRADIVDVRVREALAELPSVYSTWATEDQGWRSVGKLPQNAFGRRVMDLVPADTGDPDSIALYQEHRLVSGFLGTVHTQETITRFRSLRPGEVDPVSKGRRLDRAGYCPTLRAGTGPDRGSYQAVRPIHPTSPRVITPREAARLQGFPDWFQFDSTRWHSFRQIGNSVSPIVGEEILRAISSRVHEVKRGS
jgi:DNA (cytosine-5)-methyltransferase 1